MADHSKALNALSDVIDYPTEDLPDRVAACLACVREIDPIAGSHLAAFADRIADAPLAAIEEGYIATFDLNPVHTLDLGWQLFGEDYNRGLFLVKVRQELQRLGVPETHELPDHLTQVLMLLARMSEAEAEDFAATCVGPALRKAFGGLGEDCLYIDLTKAIMTLLEHLYPLILEEPSDAVSQ